VYDIPIPEQVTLDTLAIDKTSASAALIDKKKTAFLEHDNCMVTRDIRERQRQIAVGLPADGKGSSGNHYPSLTGQVGNQEQCGGGWLSHSNRCYPEAENWWLQIENELHFPCSLVSAIRWGQLFRLNCRATPHSWGLL
jgi:hypothetical protein